MLRWTHRELFRRVYFLDRGGGVCPLVLRWTHRERLWIVVRAYRPADVRCVGRPPSMADLTTAGRTGRGAPRDRVVAVRTGALVMLSHRVRPP